MTTDIESTSLGPTYDVRAWSARHSTRPRQTAAEAMRRLLVPVAAGMLLTGCEEDMGQDEWLRIENNTSERVFVHESDKPGDDYLIGVGPGESELALGHDACDEDELVARSGSMRGPIVATRAPNEGRDCIHTWVIELDD